MKKKEGVGIAVSAEEHYGAGMFAPLFFVLTLFGVFSALQSSYVLSVETAYLGNLTGTLTTEILYYWYFILVAIVILRLSKKYPLKRTELPRWIMIHLATLTLSFFIHQTLYIIINKTVWGEHYEGSFLFLLFNNPSFWIELLAYTVFLLGISLIDYQRTYRENEVKSIRLETELVKTRLHQVRSRIHPQFLFNTLYLLTGLLRTNRNKEANSILSLLSDFLRTTVYEYDREEVSLKDEMEFLDLYLNIETIRLHPNFHVTKNVDPSLLTVAVPSFILQPIVEEMVYIQPGHDVPECRIHISGTSQGTTLEVLIEETFEAASNNYTSNFCNGEVVSIVKERMQQFYGGESSFTCDTVQVGRLKVAMKFPQNPHRLLEEISSAKKTLLF